MSSGGRGVVFNTAEAPASNGHAMPYGRTGHFSYTCRSPSLQVRRAGPPSWRSKRRQPTENAYDGDVSDHGMDEGWQQQPIRRLLSQQMRQTLRTEESNKRLHEQWDACFNDNVFRHTCQEADRQGRSEALRARLAAEFVAAAQAIMPACPSCSETGTLESAATEQLLYVAIEGRMSVSHPVFRCTAYDGVHVVHPTSFGCFPATPTEPRICYAASLLQLTCKVGLAGPLSMEAWCNTMEAMHEWSGCTDSNSSGSGRGTRRVWRNLGMAAQQWQRMVNSAEDLDRFNITHIGSQREQLRDQIAPPAASVARQDSGDGPSESREADEGPAPGGFDGDERAAQAEQAWEGPFIGPTNQCPCCYRTCQAVMADACLGITHLRAAGRAADAIHPLQLQTPFVEDSRMKALLVQRRDLDPASLERPICSQFVAASKGFSTRQDRLHMQV